MVTLAMAHLATIKMSICSGYLKVIDLVKSKENKKTKDYQLLKSIELLQLYKTNT
jgi:hypothetical protein